MTIFIVAQANSRTEKVMWFSSWLRNWKVFAHAARRRTQTSPRQRVNFLPLLEILEDRTLLSTYTVNSLADTGTGSGLTGDLRYCITHATSGSDNITFALASPARSIWKARCQP
jgi:hypothetical protein